jgi:arylsulfatase A-like enzyme
MGAGGREPPSPVSRPPSPVSRRFADTLINAWDLMPTILALAGIPCPGTVQGRDLSGAITGAPFEEPAATLAACIAPFSEYRGEAWRAVRTRRHTYVRALSGPWLLYDNGADPYQLDNLVSRPEAAALQEAMEKTLQELLAGFNDEFAPPCTYIERWGYHVDEHGVVPYSTAIPDFGS